MHFIEKLDATSLRVRRAIEVLWIKLARTRSDIAFLSQCKFFNLIPKGLTLRNPIRTKMNKTDNICKKASELLRDHALKQAYIKQKDIFDKILSETNRLTSCHPSNVNAAAVKRDIFSSYNAELQTSFYRKNNKLAKLVSNSRYLSFENVSLKATNVKSASVNPKHQRTTISNVINLSSRNITIAEETLLNRGLSFCPTSKLDEAKLCQSTEIFCRKVRLAEYIDNSNSDNFQCHHTAHKSTVWTPPAGRNLCIDTFVNHVRGHLNTFIKSKKNLNFHNLPNEEKKALDNLMSDREIVIRKADKGGAITILNQEDYKEEILTQLSNNKFYKKLDYDPTTIYIQELKTLINNIEQPHAKTRILPLVPTCPQPGNFYTIPKIHKLSNIVKQFFTEQGNQLHVDDINDIITLAKDLKIFPPGRPIVSGIGTLTENISGFIDSILQRLMLFIPSYIKDTSEFINKLASIKTIPSDVLLVTMDVTSLYTNIPHVDGVDACSKFLNDHCVTDISTDVLCSLISFILTHNNFVFDDHDYLQTSGTAMGTKMAPCFANIFMASIEQTFIDSSPLAPLFYVRFIDDIFMIWTHGSEELEQFITRANSTHPSIKFTT